MSTRSFIRFIHRADIWAYSEEITPSGQKKGSWAVASTNQHIYYVPGGSRVTTTPTWDTDDKFTVYFPHNASITTKSRIYNISDSRGNAIEDGPLEIVQIKKFTGYRGRINHLQCKLERVIHND